MLLRGPVGNVIAPNCVTEHDANCNVANRNSKKSVSGLYCSPRSEIAPLILDNLERASFFLDSVVWYRVYSSRNEVITMEIFSIGRLARRAGVGIETVRFYERTGLLEEPVRRASGYRQYSEEAVKHIRFIK
jgi:hypothetical protein